MAARRFCGSLIFGAVFTLMSVPPLLSTASWTPEGSSQKENAASFG